jgi:hypothetical protein
MLRMMIVGLRVRLGVGDHDAAAELAQPWPCGSSVQGSSCRPQSGLEPARGRSQVTRRAGTGPVTRFGPGPGPKT